MKQIINFILIFGVLYVSNILYPRYVVSDGVKTLLVVTLAVYLVDLVLTILVLAFGAVSVKLDSRFLIGCFIVGVMVLYIALPIISMLVCERYINTFQVNGLLTYIFLTIAFHIFHLKEKEEK